MQNESAVDFYAGSDFGDGQWIDESRGEDGRISADERALCEAATTPGARPRALGHALGRDVIVAFAFDGRKSAHAAYAGACG